MFELAFGKRVLRGMDGQQFALVAAAEEGRAATAHKLLLAVQQKGEVGTRD